MKAVVVLVVAAACSRDSRAPSQAQPAPARPEPAAIALPPQPAPPPRPAQLARVTIKALGMYCEESCPLQVRYALADVTSVYELGFDLSTESIFVSYDATLGPAKEVTKPMIAAIKKAGFDPWLAKESWPADAEAQVVMR
jgi:hypothetical protein